jgi:mitogen-activated protein kinase-activated protein kinase 3
MELHCRALAGPHIVRVLSLYENLHQGRRCLLMVMEW